jgi:His-Xaa-Ser repeat protein HxsA
MNPTHKKGFFARSKKSLSIITASIAVMAHSNASAAPVSNYESNDVTGSETSSKRILKPKLVLKLNVNNPELSRVSMHASHSSHASHASHASSSPSYTPSTYTPPPPAPTPAPTYTPPAPTLPASKYNSTYTPAEPTTQRTLYKGCNGDDVKQLQALLIQKGYKVPSSGYFGAQTEVAVKKFQKLNDLPTDGKVGSVTLSMLSQ